MNFPIHSRLHPLPFLSHPDCEVFIKRDDELLGGIGTKARKYASLLPAIPKNTPVHVLGGPHSNNVLALTQILKQEGIEPKLFLKRSRSTQSPKKQEPHHTEKAHKNLVLRQLQPEKACGNFLMLSQLQPSITWVDDFQEAQSPDAFVIPEGAAHPAAIEGLFSLAQEIHEQGPYDHILTVAGTGQMASILSLGLGLLGSKATLHLLLLADDQAHFLERFENWKRLFELWAETSVQAVPFKFYTPSIGKSFGPQTSAHWKFHQHFAEKTGIFLDPIYNGKLFFEAENIIKPLRGKALILHCGGVNSLMGFSHQIQKTLNKSLTIN